MVDLNVSMDVNMAVVDNLDRVPIIFQNSLNSETSDLENFSLRILVKQI